MLVTLLPAPPIQNAIYTSAVNDVPGERPIILTEAFEVGKDQSILKCSFGDFKYLNKNHQKNL